MDEEAAERLDRIEKKLDLVVKILGAADHAWQGVYIQEYKALGQQRGKTFIAKSEASDNIEHI